MHINIDSESAKYFAWFINGALLATLFDFASVFS